MFKSLNLGSTFLSKDNIFSNHLSSIDENTLGTGQARKAKVTDLGSLNNYLIDDFKSNSFFLGVMVVRRSLVLVDIFRASWPF
jgi:hypothetical protein